ncbi:MAG: mannitol dehydrogenase family protein [Kiritimatiellae bacterium]|nr:mannitol dehydrogenase family protein [Kiritimatiellia bacterium]
MKLNLDSIRNEKAAWEKANVKLPTFDIAAVRERTAAHPEWVHFGAGNIFRGFIGSLNQRLLEKGLVDTGIVACDTFDYEVIEKIYDAHDSLTLNVLLNPDGTTTREVLAGVAEGVKVDFSSAESAAKMRSLFTAQSLKLVSFTITEKGYRLRSPDGEYLPVVASDIKAGPSAPCHVMSIVASLLLERFKANAAPIAVVSMDNCAHNGDKLRESVVEIAHAWVENSFAPSEFLNYIEDEKKVSFPWTMIDKITPRPHPQVRKSLEDDGIEGMEPIITSRKTFIAAFVNAEKPQYLVVEDSFPNGRPQLEESGVVFCDRESVDKCEKMKVTTCLNPLHTAMSMYGCLLGYTLICEEMKDEDIVRLIRTLGYKEGLPVVVDPGIISPKAFIDEVVCERLPNPFMPDDPRRIATDTSQKLGPRFGETIKSYIRKGLSLDSLVAIPMAIAGWLRYLQGTFDDGTPMEVSPDPLKDELMAKVAAGEIRSILSNASIFGLDLTQTSLASRIEGYYERLSAGAGSVRKFLKEELEG